MRPFYHILALSLSLSVLSAWLAESLLVERITVFGSFAGLQLSRNSGIAFGINLPQGLQEILIFTALVLVLGMALTSKHSQLVYTGFGLIIGGGLANIIDRIPDGLVTDYFQVGTFPIFNVADSCVTVGVFLLFLELLWNKKHHG